MKMKYEGRVWVIREENGKMIDDIDTDMIFHNRHLAITELSEMGRYAFGNLEGYQDLPERVEEGDIILVGQNFGSGSSRQQAVDCFISLGVGAIMARSYGAIYKRNAINVAFPIFTIRNLNLEAPEAPDYINSGDIIRIDTDTGAISREDVQVGEMELPSRVQMDIIDAGGLFEYGKKISQ